MGLGGINYHVVLEAPPRPLGSDRVHVLRAADERALGEALRNTDAAAWFETKDLGRGPVVCAIAADDASGLNDRMATERKAGLLPGTPGKGSSFEQKLGRATRLACCSAGKGRSTPA